MTNTPFIFYAVLYLLIPFAYVIGSIPFGVLISKKKGIDLTAAGSRNIGATNVLRTAGRIPAILTLMGDSLKGAIPVLICRFIIVNIEQAEPLESIYRDRALWEGIIGLLAVLGHIYPVFLSFRGGKGVATSFGVLLVYSPAPALYILLIWILVAVSTRYSSLAAICASIALPIIFLLLKLPVIKIYFGIFFAFLIILKHMPNIKRLMERTEPRIG